MNYKQRNEEFAKELARITNASEKMNLPESILFEFDNKNKNQINVVIGKKAATDNMQKDGASFEGWILSIVSKLKGYKVYLDADDQFEKYGKLEENQKEKNRGTYNRCLYRINRFSSQFSSFLILSNKLDKLSKTLYINGAEKPIDQIELVVNRPEGIAGVNQHAEILIEALLSKHPERLLKETERIIQKKMDKEVNRQLPVGIFEKDLCKKGLKEKNKIFTAGHAAIDLWSISDDGEDLCIYELKKMAEKNATNNKVGIVSELFFYGNLMYDLYCEKNNFSVSEGDEIGRGFDKILASKNKIKNIHAFFLVEQLHKEIKNVLPLLNNNSKISYHLLQYELRIF